MESPGPSKKAIIGLVVIVLLVIAATGAVIAANDNGTPTSTGSTALTSPASSPSASKSDSATSSDASTYKEGTYTAKGTYNSPGGEQSIKVSVTLASDGTISGTSVTQQPTDAEAQGYQGQFAANYKSMVVGKKISDVSLSRVAGSSLTSIGFNDAIDTIKSQAAA